MKSVKTKTYVKATASLNEEVEKELEIMDPTNEEESAAARISRNNNASGEKDSP